jgi:hypothetical protein
MDYSYVTDTKQSEFQNWLNNFDNMLSQWYSDPANEQDDIDRIYRQQEIEEWVSLLEAYGRGEVEYNTLINWKPDYLRDIDGFNDYLDDVRFKATWERNTNYNIGYCEENGCRDAAMQRFYDKWKASGEPTTKDGMWSDEQFDEWLEEQDNGGGVDPVDPVDPGPAPPQTLDEALDELAEEQQVDRDVVDGVVDMIETIKGSVPTNVEDASDLIRGVLSSTVLGSALEECESWTGNTTTEGGRGVPSWTKCVTAGIFDIPGLDLPLPPGMIDISVSVYDIIQKGEDIGESFEDFLEDPSGWLENVIDKAVEKVQEVWGDLQGGIDPKTIGGLSGILNDWIGNILGGYILSQVKDATSAIDPFLFAGDCLDPTFKEANEDFCEDALNEGALVDCSTFGKTGGLVASEAECGACEDPNFTPTGPNGTCVEPWTDQGETEDQCAAQGRLHVPGDASTETASACGDCLPTHTEEGGTCTEWADGGATEEECTEQNRVYRPSTGTGRDSSCGGCLEGYEGPECEEIGVEEPCPGNQIRNEETRECEDPGPDFVVGDPCTTEVGDAGTYDSEGGCVPDWVNTGPSVQDCEALGKTHVSGDPSAQKPSECGGCKNSTWNPIGAEGECVAPEDPVDPVDPNECDEDNLTPQNAEACGKQLCDGVYIDIGLPCVPVIPPEGCGEGEADFGRGCEQPCPDDANIGISDAACVDTTVTTCLDDAATNFNEEGPCVYGPVVETCENGAIDPPLCSECADGGLPDAELGCGGTVDNPCDDPVYAAENPTECASGDDCVDCDCPEYAAANPEECIGTPPPEGGGGGPGGGGGGQGKIEPIEIGISGDPELLARQQFPITDYLSGLFTGRR